MSKINLLLNYYLENSYINLNNNIEPDDLNLLIESIEKYNINIICINVPKDFKYLNILLKKYNKKIIIFND